MSEEAQRLWALDFDDEAFLSAELDPALVALHDAHGAAGDDYDDQIERTRERLVDYLNAHY